MPQFKLKSKIKGFKSLTGMTAQVFNEDGDLLDTINLNDSKSKLKFKFDKDDALQGQNNADLTIKLTDTNGDAVNLKTADGNELDLNSDEQTFSATIKGNKKKGKAKFTPTGTSNEVVDTDAPVFTSSDASSVSESTAPGTVIYDADATDASTLSFSLSGTDAGSFSIDSATGQVSINASPDFDSKSSYSFDVVATDAAGNSSSQTVALSVTETPVVPPTPEISGKTINLTTFQDVYDDATGTTVNASGVQTVRNERLSSLDNTIVGTAGELGQNDSLSDPSTSDSDTLTIATSAGNSSLQTSLAGVQNITNVENLLVNASNDDSTTFDFSQVIGMDSLDINGFYTADVTLQDFFDSAQISSFDFSGATNPNVGFTVDPLANNTAQTFSNEELSFIGSPGNDDFRGSIASMTAIGGAGDDTIHSSTNSSSYIEGGNGIDDVRLFNLAGQIDANNALQNGATDTVSYKGITSDNNATNVQLFVGFGNADNAAEDQHDILEFDAITNTNYTAGAPVVQRTVDQVTNVLGQNGANNVFLVDTAAAIANADLRQHNTSWLALDDTGALLYSADGNFANAEQIGSLTFGGTNGAFADFVASENVSIV